MASYSGGSQGSPASAHPLLAAARSIHDALDSVKGVDPLWMSASDKAAALLELDRARDRIAATEFAVLAHAEDVAAESGARSPSAWLTAATLRDRGSCAADEHLASGLHQWEAVGVALAAGDMNIEQARVVVSALDALPADLVGASLLIEAETYLVAQAADFGPKELRNLGAHLLGVIAPDKLEEAERRKIEAEMERARKRTRLTLRPNRDGTTTLNATLPDGAADRLRIYLDAIASPRRNPETAEREEPAGFATYDAATGRRIPADQIRGRAFMTLLEHLDPSKLPAHGGLATTVMVTIRLEDLQAEFGKVGLAAGGSISAGEARRLACDAGIIPVVLGARSEVLDLGRKRRLCSPAQRKAMAVLHPTCMAEGCVVPAEHCELHHLDPWSRGGRTDLDRIFQGCSHHHDRMHDAAYDHSRLPNGDYRFHRRT